MSTTRNQKRFGDLDKNGASDTPPTFEHDCEYCKYLGWTKHEGAIYDLYVCPKENGTLIARHGSIGTDYTSGLWFAAWNLSHQQGKPSHPLAEALRRAIFRAASR